MTLVLTTPTNPGDADWTDGALAQNLSFFADNLDNPIPATDWVVPVLAAATVDTNNSGFIIRAFDDTTEEGVGFSLTIPSEATTIIIGLKSRADTAPVTAAQVIPTLYAREIPNNAAVGAWSAGTDLTALDFPLGTEFFQYDEQVFTLTSLGLNAGSLYQFELTRSTTGTLTDDWFLYELSIAFS